MATISTDRLYGLNSSVAIKSPVAAATTENITLSGEQTIDGVSCTDGDRVLVKDQSTSTENGIYNVSTGAWSRSADFDGTRDVVQGTTVKVVAGTINAAQWFNVTTSNPIVPDSSSIAFAQTYASLTTVSAATESSSGTVELATQTETDTGSDDARAITPLKLVTHVVSYVAAQITALLAAAKTVTGRWTFTDTTSTVQELTDGATISWDVSAGNVAEVTLTADGHAFDAPTNIQAGGFYFLLVIQDATGSRTVTWDSAFNFGTVGTPTLTTTASATDVFTFYSPDGSSLYCVGRSAGF